LNNPGPPNAATNFAMRTTSPDSILSTLNKAQCRAVTSPANTVAILAGPGSGKTHTLTSRVVWLIDHVGYEPDDVIVATFTVKAAREMKERIGKTLSNGREKKIILGTFHSVARRYLAAYGRRIGLDKKFGIADDTDSRAIIRRVIKRLNLSLDPAAARAWISKRKAKGSPDVSSEQPGKGQRNADLESCYQEYQDHLERSKLLDYDDLLTRCVELLRAFPSCVSNVQAVLIDEYQDTNGIQYELMKLLAQAQNRITIVGDPDQSIYGWRSAEIKNLHRMLKDYPQTDRISLEENYRSSERILALSLRVIQQDKERYEKALLPTHNKGTRPVLRRLKSSAAEADWIVSEMKRCMVMTGSMMTHDDMAILLRSASLSRHIEAALGRAGIPYRMVGGFKFYERAEIKILLDYLRVVYQPHNNDALARVLNTPKRGFGDATIKVLLEEAETSNRSLWTVLVQHCRGDRTSQTKISNKAEQNFSGGLKRMIEKLRDKVDKVAEKGPCDLEALINELLDHLKFKNYLEDTYGPELELRWANAQEFVTLAKDFMRELDEKEEDALPDIEGLEQAKDTDALGRFLSNVSLASDVQVEDDSASNKPLVTISTIHAAKGLEWPMVFVPSVFEGMIPHGRTEDLSEERRLLYVSMTRAKAFLYLSCPKINARGEEVQLSQFLPPEIATGFARKGPSLEKSVLEEAGRILGREPPTDEMVYGNMPSMFSPEDDLFPVDPDQVVPNNRPGHEINTDSHRQKRQRTQIGDNARRELMEPPWQRSYSTTMERAAHFSMPASTGFVTASIHQAAILEAAVAAAAPAAPAAVERKHVAKATTRLPANQMSMLGFLKGGAKPNGETTRQSTTPAVQQSQPPSRSHVPIVLSTLFAPPQPPAIAPELANHKLRRVNAAPKPMTTMRNDEAPPDYYTWFSSSPTKPPALQANTTEEKVTKPLPQPLFRPAATFHSTTMSVLRASGTVRKPPGLKSDGVSALSTLRKPFKPLTISRSGQNRS
jgi:DNA helicase II / ATP-dependent DNA helicase PcrA